MIKKDFCSFGTKTAATIDWKRNNFMCHHCITDPTEQ